MLAAAHAMVKEWPARFSRAPPKQPVPFMERTIANFDATDSLAPATSPGRPRKIPDRAAAAAAVIFRSGYAVTQTVGAGHPPIIKRRGYETIDDAIAREPRLRAYIARYNVTPETLLASIKRADPTIKRVSVDVKRALTQAEMDYRQARAAEYVRRARAGRAFTDRLVFLDEGALVLLNPDEVRHYVYKSTDDYRMADVISVPKMKAGKEIVLRFYLVANARVGAVLCYPTTGTTDLDRRYRAFIAPGIDNFKVGACAAGPAQTRGVPVCRCAPRPGALPSAPPANSAAGPVAEGC